MSEGGEGGFLNFDNVEERGGVWLENPCFCRKSFVDDPYSDLICISPIFCVILEKYYHTGRNLYENWCKKKKLEC